MFRALVKYALIVFVGVVVVVWIFAPTRSPQYASVPLPKNSVRRLEAGAVQGQLLQMGYDVQVSFVDEDDSKMIVFGKSVNRPFAYNLMRRSDFRKMLRDAKFSEVTFMDSTTTPDFVQTFAVR